MDQLKTISINVAVITVISLILLAGNTQYRQWSQYVKGEDAEKRGDVHQAIAGYEAAIHMYTPFSPLITSAAERLWLMADLAEKRGDQQEALIICRALRSSFYSVKWLMQPGEEWINRCDKRIAVLVKQ